MVKDLRVAGRQSRTGSDHGRPTAKTARLVGIYRTHRALRAVTWNDARMDASFWVAVVAVVVSIAAVVVAIVLGVFTVRLARQANANGQAQVAAADQQFRAALDQQREQQHQWEQLQQPNVWADLRPDDGQGGLLMLYVANSGPTLARNVRVTFDPPLIPEPRRSDTLVKAQEVLARGISSLAPGYRYAWSLGGAGVTIPLGPPDGYLVKLDAIGPFGPVPTIEYELNPLDFYQNLTTPPGTLHSVAVAIREATAQLQKTYVSVQRRAEELAADDD